MATGLIKTDTVTDTRINLSSNSSGWVHVVKCGRVVCLTGYITMSSSATGTYKTFQVGSGLPPNACNDENQGNGMVLFDNTTALWGIVTVKQSGAIYISSRATAIASKQGPFFASYITSE